jgi:hypothetical protein
MHTNLGKLTTHEALNILSSSLNAVWVKKSERTRWADDKNYMYHLKWKNSREENT